MSRPLVVSAPAAMSRRPRPSYQGEVGSVVGSGAMSGLAMIAAASSGVSA